MITGTITFTAAFINRFRSLSVPCGQAMFPEVYAALGYKPAGPVPTPFAGFGSSAVQIGHIFPSILHKDAFLIFRALCKLSNKGKLDENENVYDPITLQNKYSVYCDSSL